MIVSAPVSFHRWPHSGLRPAGASQLDFGTKPTEISQISLHLFYDFHVQRRQSVYCSNFLIEGIPTWTFRRNVWPGSAFWNIEVAGSVKWSDLTAGHLHWHCREKVDTQIDAKKIPKTFPQQIVTCYLIPIRYLCNFVRGGCIQEEWCVWKTSQELRMLSSVTLNCQVTKIVMNSGSQF